jgi:hypothetical protein
LSGRALSAGDVQSSNRARRGRVRSPPIGAKGPRRLASRALLPLLQRHVSTARPTGMPILAKVVTRRTVCSSMRTIKRPDPTVAPLIAWAAQLSARLTSAKDTAVPIRTAAVVNENQARVVAAGVADRHGLSVRHSDHQTQSAGGYPVLQHNGHSFLSHHLAVTSRQEGCGLSLAKLTIRPSAVNGF